MMQLSSLQRTLSLHFLLVAILPALTFGLIAENLLRRHVQDGIYQQNQLLCEDVVATTGMFLAAAERELSTVAGVIDAEALLHPEAVDEFLSITVLTSGRFESIYHLDRALRVKNLGMGRRVSPSLDVLHGSDYSRHPLFMRQAVIEQAIWSSVFLSPHTGVPTVALALPMQDGVLLGNISLQALDVMMVRLAEGSGDLFAIYDRDGVPVARSLSDLGMYPEDPGRHAAIAQALSGQRQTVVERHFDRLYLESTAQIDRTGWIAWVGVDLKERMAALDDVRFLLVGFMLLALFLAGTIALFDVRRLLLPLADLNRRTAQIGAGIYDFQPQPSGLSEIDNLAGSLQQMALAIRDRERSLVESEQRFRNLVNSIDGVVWEMDVDSGRYLFVSEQSATLFGYSPSRWLNEPDFWLSRVHPEDRRRVVLRDRLDFLVAVRHDHEYRFSAANGRLLWIRDLVNVIREDGRPRRLLGVMIDATVRKQAAEELERYRSDLEVLVRQRTLELQAAQDKLVQKERLAVLGQLTATVSHEIRNPLGTVSNALYMLRETLGNHCLDRVERALQLAERNVARCDGIISELLDFTRRRELQMVSTDLDQWLAGVLDEMAWPADVRCLRHLGSAAIVPVDPERLRRALINIIDNALQAMEGALPGEKLVAISTRRDAERCEIEVRDTGVGIPAEFIERIYEPMFSTKSFGVGLGVPIIRNIIEDHGGGVDYRSRVGEGTTVTLWLPCPTTPDGAGSSPS